MSHHSCIFRSLCAGPGSADFDYDALLFRHRSLADSLARVHGLLLIDSQIWVQLLWPDILLANIYANAAIFLVVFPLVVYLIFYGSSHVMFVLSDEAGTNLDDYILIIY